MVLVETEIDGQKIEVERDRWALDAARSLGIEIPTLCHHPALAPYGACRLCMVEVSKRQATWLTTACDLPVREGLTIRTNTHDVIGARKMAVELLLAQAPDATRIQDLAKKLGVTESRFPARSGLGKCILCGLCIRTCRAILGEPAICVSRRGADRRVGSPFGEASEACTGCLACVQICPTGHIESVDDGPVRRLETWKTELELAQCSACGRSFATVRELELARAKSPEHFTFATICPACRRSQTAGRIANAAQKIRQTGHGPKADQSR